MCIRDSNITTSSGIYFVTVTDENDCTTSEQITIENYQNPILSLSSTATTCGLDNAQITATVSDGQAPYTYQWSHDDELTSNIADNLASIDNDYTVTVIDSNGCSETASISITNSEPMIITETNSQNSSCNESNGFAQVVNVENATGNLTYNWNDVNAQTTETATNLSAGTYTVTVTDENACQATASVIVNDTSVPTINIDSQNNPTCEQNNGEISILSLIHISEPTRP